MLLHLVSLNIKARLQYGRSIIYEMLISMVGYLFEFLAVWIIINQFKVIDGWGFAEIVFLHALGYFVRATSSAFLWDAMWSMSNYMKNGDLDKFLTAPVNPFVYIVGRNFMPYALSHVILGLVVFILTLFFLQINWTLINGILFLCALIGALLIYGSFIIFSGAISFWVIRSHYFLNALTESWNIINYPLTIYPRGLQLLLTFAIPFALLNYYPAVFILDQRDINGLSMIGILIIGIILFTVMYKIWNLGVKKYQGTGS